MSLIGCAYTSSLSSVFLPEFSHSGAICPCHHWQLEIKTRKEKWDLREERGRGPLGGRKAIAWTRSLISSPQQGYIMWGMVSLKCLFLLSRAVGALSIFQFSKVWIKSWLSCFSEGTVYCSVGHIIFNKHL